MYPVPVGYCVVERKRGILDYTKCRSWIAQSQPDPTRKLPLHHHIYREHSSRSAVATTAQDQTGRRCGRCCELYYLISHPYAFAHCDRCLRGRKNISEAVFMMPSGSKLSQFCTVCRIRCCFGRKSWKIGHFHMTRSLSDVVDR